MGRLIKKILEDKKTGLALLLEALWMAVIFGFSAQPADESSNISGFVKELIDRVLNAIFGGGAFGAFLQATLFNEHLVRKLGHVTEYLVLGILTAFLTKRLFIRKTVLIALIICALYASSDELHQMFVPGRGPLATDVLLDTAASAAGILIAGMKSLFGRSVADTQADSG